DEPCAFRQPAVRTRTLINPTCGRCGSRDCRVGMITAAGAGPATVLFTICGLIIFFASLTQEHSIRCASRVTRKTCMLLAESGPRVRLLRSASMQRRDFLKLAATPLLAASERRPNILFVFPDQLRYDWTGLNTKLPLRTPNLNRLAAGGTTFTRNVVASPLCAPSRACLASGREYDRCGT